MEKNAERKANSASAKPEPAPSESQRTGPTTGNPRGNDLPSETRTQKDVRRVEGGGTSHRRPDLDQPGGPNPSERIQNDSHPASRRDASAKLGQPADTSEVTAGNQRDAVDGD